MAPELFEDLCKFDIELLGSISHGLVPSISTVV
jgi:hypothetical protein